MPQLSPSTLASFPSLPISPLLAELQARLSTAPALVLQAPPGAGKTTLVPLALLDAAWLNGGRIIMLEPRRLAVRAAASRMAALLGESVGETVGYRMRFESKVSQRTRIEVVTEGILTRRLQGDPELNGIGLLIFDEFHERSLHADLALALAHDTQRGLREDLRLLLMSATLDGERLSRALGDAPLLTSAGRSHPVDIHYAARESDAPPAETLVRGVLAALRAEESGDVLAFLPGSGEIRRAAAALAAELGDSVSVLPLYGELPFAEQQRALQPDARGRRRVVLATSIAETSLTIDGIRVVVDAGYARQPRFDPRSGLSRLETVRISRAAAEQRAGRAGRLGPGVCYRLWTPATDATLRPHTSPEILDADLAPLALELAAWGAPADALLWLDPPNPGALAQAQALLRQLDALDVDSRISAGGRALLELGLHPRLAHLLLAGRRDGCPALACDVAALLEERDVLRGEAARSADLTLRLEALATLRARGRGALRELGADGNGCERVEQAARALRQRLGSRADAEPIRASQVARLLAAAYPERIARRRDGSPDRYLLANGRGARLREGDPLSGADWLAVASLDAGEREGRIFLAAELDAPTLEDVLAAHIDSAASVRWDEREAAVVAREERRLGAILIDAKALARPAPEALRAAMCTGIERLGLDALPWTPALREWQARVLSLRAWLGADWPDVSDTALAARLNDWLAPYLDGISRREHLARLDLGAILRARLDWAQAQQLDALAPTHLEVPSGSRLRLSYTVDGAAPVLAVKLQEMFGLADTPRIANGRIAVTLHLLSPAQRPIQVTQDLRGFWERTYAEVKKELKGRYPKHPWPDDPWTATATRRAKPRGT